MGCKAAETTHINNAFVPETAGDKNLKDDECSGWPLEVDNNKLRVVIEADPLTTAWEVAAQFNINHSMVIWHLEQIGKFNKWVPHEPTENKRNCRFWSVIICNNNKTFLDRIVMCNEQWTSYDNWWWPARWLDREEAPKHFPTPNLHQKLVMVTVGQSAVRLIHYSFLNSSGNFPSEKCDQKINEMHPNCSVCSWRRSTERAQFSSSWQCPTIGHTIDASKVEQTWLQSFASYAIFTWPLANRLPLLQASRQLFAGQMLPQPAGDRRCFPRKSSSNPEAQIFMLQEWANLFLVGKNVLILSWFLFC